MESQQRNGNYLKVWSGNSKAENKSIRNKYNWLGLRADMKRQNKGSISLKNRSIEIIQPKGQRKNIGKEV